MYSKDEIRRTRIKAVAARRKTTMVAIDGETFEFVPITMGVIAELEVEAIAAGYDDLEHYIFEFGGLVSFLYQCVVGDVTRHELSMAIRTMDGDEAQDIIGLVMEMDE